MKSLGTDPNVIVLSNHINAGGGEGAEVVYPLRSSSTLAKNILDEIGARGQIKTMVIDVILQGISTGPNPATEQHWVNEMV